MASCACVRGAFVLISFNLWAPGYHKVNESAIDIMERLQNRYTAQQLTNVCACITGLQHVQCTDSNHADMAISHNRYDH